MIICGVRTRANNNGTREIFGDRDMGDTSYTLDINTARNAWPPSPWFMAKILTENQIATEEEPVVLDVSIRARKRQ